MDHISIFNGIGGFQLAAEWAGWNNVMSCEIDPFCNQVTKYYWPDCKQYEDIRKTDFTVWKGKADVLTGGFPCQPYSNAGRRKGTNDDRYLWPEMLRAIDESRPTWVVGENVTGILTMEDTRGITKEVFPKMEGRTIVRYQEIDLYEAVYSRQKKMLVESICEDLERIGYEVQPMAIPAASIGAPHKRERIWFIAHTNDWGRSEYGLRSRGAMSKNRSETNGDVTHSNSERCHNRSHHRKKRHVQNYENRDAKENKSERDRWEFGISKNGKNGVITNSNSKLSQRRCNTQQHQTSKRHTGASFCAKNWKNFPTETPICDGDDGLSAKLDTITFSKWRRKSIEAGGNAIVPQVALEIFEGINSLEAVYYK